MAPEKERVKNTPQNIRFFHPESKTAENHIVPVSIPVSYTHLDVYKRQAVASLL